MKTIAIVIMLLAAIGVVGGIASKQYSGALWALSTIVWVIIWWTKS